MSELTKEEALKQVGNRLYAIGMRAAERKRYGYGNDSPSQLEVEITDLALDLDPSGILGRALSSPCACGEPIARGWAMPVRSYYAGLRRMGRDRTVQIDRQVRVFLDRAPKGSQPVIILADEPQEGEP